MKSIKLLYLPKEGYPNNRVRITELFMKEYTDIGNEIFWIFQSKLANEIQKFNKNGNQIFVYPFCGKGSPLGNFANRFCKIKKYYYSKKIIDENHIDIILANDGIIEGFVALFLSRKYKIPFVFYLSSIFYSIDRWEFKESKNFKNFYLLMESYVKEPLYQFLINCSDIFHPISETMQDLYSEKSENGTVLALPLCPGRGFLERTKSNGVIGPEVKIILIGSIGRTRKIDFFIDMMKKITERYTEKKVILEFIGKFPDQEYRNIIMNKIEENKLRDNIIFSKEIPIDEVPEVLSGSDIGLSVYPPIPSWQAGSPSKLVEYIAVGLPFIANIEIPDQKKLAERSKAGLLTGYDSDEVANAVISMIEGYDKYFQMSKDGMKWIRKNRTYGSIAKKLDTLYRECIDRRDKG